MATIRLIHWNGPEGRERKLRLASLGHHVEFDDLEGSGLMKVLRRDVPDAYVIDLSRLPSSGRTVAMWLRTNKATRALPLLFVDGDPAKVKQVRALLPDAVYTSWGGLKTAIPRALAKPPADPIVPPSSIYTGRSLADKLGIKAGMRVGIVTAPRGFLQLLRPAPAGVRYTARASAESALVVAFARSRQELFAHVTTLGALLTRQTLWLAWPKKASGVKSDLDGNVVRDTGLAAGWVDFKVCSMDERWSGLAFKRRRVRPNGAGTDRV